MDSHAKPRAFIDLLSPCPGDCPDRMAVMALASVSHSQNLQTASWAWLLTAPGQKNALLYTGKASVGNLHESQFAALAALGNYLGTAANVLALLPTPLPALCEANSEPIPAAFRQPILAKFELGPKYLDLSRSSLVVQTAMLGRWDGLQKLRNRAWQAMRGQKDSDYQVLKTCPHCGEIILDGCGCARAKQIFPSFYSPLLPGNGVPPNYVKRYSLQAINSRFAIDYRRSFSECKVCNGLLVPIADKAACWICRDCGTLFDNTGNKIAPQELAVPAASGTKKAFSQVS